MPLPDFTNPLAAHRPTLTPTEFTELVCGLCRGGNPCADEVGYAISLSVHDLAHKYAPNADKQHTIARALQSLFNWIDDETARRSQAERAND